MPIGLEGEDVRVLEIQRDGPRAFLWAGLTAAGGNDPGKGCCSWELFGSTESPEGWRHWTEAWQGGSCRALAFRGAEVLAASHRAGILRLDAVKSDAAWVASEVRCGLPLRDVGRLLPVDALAVDPTARLVMAGGGEGIYGSTDGGIAFDACSRDKALDRVSLPPTWLFCSGEHDITVVSEAAAEEQGENDDATS